MRILVDADACPRSVLQTCLSVGQKFGIPVWTVASMIQVPDGTVTAEGKATAVKLPDHFRNSVDIEADRKYWRVE